MSAIERSFDTLSFLTDGARDAVRRRVREAAGVALIVVAMLLAAALASWSVQAPSLSHATDAPVHNLLGVTGAMLADLLMQLLGIAAVALVLPVAIWGWRLTTHRPLYHERLRLAVWLLAVLLTASFASCLPRTPAWPLPAGLGGVFGDALLRLSVLLGGGGVLATTRIVIGFLSGVGAVVAFAIAAGITWHERRDADDPDKPVTVVKPDQDDEGEEEERLSISLGWIVHALLSLKWRIARFIAGRAAGRDAARAPKTRAEPRFENYQAALRDLEHEVAEDEYESEEEDEEEEDAPQARRKPRAAPKP